MLRLPRRHTLQKRASGMTLIEVMVALAIIGLALTAATMSVASPPDLATPASGDAAESSVPTDR